MGFSGQEQWSGWPFSLLGDLSEPSFLALADGFFTTAPPEKPKIGAPRTRRQEPGFQKNNSELTLTSYPTRWHCRLPNQNLKAANPSSF